MNSDDIIPKYEPKKASLLVTNILIRMCVSMSYSLIDYSLIVSYKPEVDPYSSPTLLPNYFHASQYKLNPHMTFPSGKEVLSPLYREASSVSQK